MSSKNIMTLSLTIEQREMMQAMLQQMEMENCIISNTSRQEDANNEAINHLGPTTASDQDISSVPSSTGKCQHCFLQPCVAVCNMNARWIGPGRGPHENNSGIRKSIYKKFWKVIANLGGWNTEEYLEKKRLHGSVISVREIMPLCVLELARDKYPNLKGVPYMNHLWD